MPFGNLTATSGTYEPRDVGYYSHSSVDFGELLNEFRFRQASKGKDGFYRTSISKVQHYVDPVDDSEKPLIVTVNITSPGFSNSAAIRAALVDLSEVLTEVRISRNMLGEI